MTQAFQKLSYLLGLLKKLRNKAMGIFKKGSEEKETMNGRDLVVTYVKEVEAVRIAYASGQKLQDLV